jgi:hypothetical protein
LVVTHCFLSQPRKEAGRSRIGKQRLPSSIIAHLVQKKGRQRFLLLFRLPLGQGERLS